MSLTRGAPIGTIRVMNHRRFVFLALSTFTLYAAALAACAPDSSISGSSQSGSTSSTGSGAGSVGNGGMGGEGGSLFGGHPGTGANDGGLDPDSACGVVREKGKAIPLSLYIAFDKSSSMQTGGKWTSAKNGLAAFVTDPASAGTSVALNFFPIADETTCDQFKYKTPLVPFGELPGNAQAIQDTINLQMPTGSKTPLYPALGGAILECADALQQKPNTACAVLLVTDGEPVGPAPTCGGVNPEDPAQIAALAATGLSQFKVLTFVIGLPGIPKTIADQIAVGGGTDAAILTGNVNVQQEFQNALAKARGKALPCEYEMPDKVTGGEYDTNFVNVLFTPSAGGNAMTIPQNADCAGGSGWYYDNPLVPTKIHLCPSTCTTVRTDYGAAVDILLGCATEVAK
jgi:hypothetical protein